MTDPRRPRGYFVLFITTTAHSMDEVTAEAPDALSAHITRSNRFHAEGTLLMAGAFLDRPTEPVTTMAVFTNRDSAEAYAKGDPFMLAGMVSNYSIRPWASILT